MQKELADEILRLATNDGERSINNPFQITAGDWVRLVKLAAAQRDRA